MQRGTSGKASGCALAVLLLLFSARNAVPAEMTCSSCCPHSRSSAREAAKSATLPPCSTSSTTADSGGGERSPVRRRLVSTMSSTFVLAFWVAGESLTAACPPLSALFGISGYTRFAPFDWRAPSTSSLDSSSAVSSFNRTSWVVADACPQRNLTTVSGWRVGMRVFRIAGTAGKKVCLPEGACEVWRVNPSRIVKIVSKSEQGHNKK